MTLLSGSFDLVLEDTAVDVHVLREVVYSIDGKRPSPLAMLVRYDVAARIFLWCVLAQAIDDDGRPTQMSKLLPAVGLAAKDQRRNDKGVEHPEVRTGRSRPTHVAQGAVGLPAPGGGTRFC